MNGRFLINRRNAKMMGVAAGLADYTGFDPTVIRLADGQILVGGGNDSREAVPWLEFFAPDGRSPSKPHPVQLVTGRRCRAGARAYFLIRATDRDGDTLTYRWRLDGLVLPARTARMTIRLRRRGFHRISVTVSDGQGRATRAVARIRVT